MRLNLVVELEAEGSVTTGELRGIAADAAVLVAEWRKRGCRVRVLDSRVVQPRAELRANSGSRGCAVPGCGCGLASHRPPA